MPFNYLATIALTTCFAMAVATGSAMSPEIRLPEWQKTRIDISEWKPEQKMLTIRVDIEATAARLENVLSQVHLPDEIKANPGRHERPVLEKGDKAVFLHQFSIEPGFAGWAEIELLAQPSREDILQLIRNAHAKEPATLAILEAEAMTISKPMPFGRSLPLLVRNDIAMCTAAPTALKPDLKAMNQEFYLWYPEAGLGKGLTGEGLKTFSAALTTGNLKTAEAAGKMLTSRLETGKEPLSKTVNEKETFAIPTGIVIEMIKADLETLKAVNAKDPEILAVTVEKMQPCYTRPFLMYNLAALYESQKNKSKAREWYAKAIAEIPAWPLAEKHLADLKN